MADASYTHEVTGTIDSSADANRAGGNQMPPTVVNDPQPGMTAGPHFTGMAGPKGPESKN